jgi:uncharacterized membrane protein
VLESLFEFLFKYRPLIFEQGDLRFAAFTPVSVAVVAAAAGAAATILTYTGVRGQLRARDRAALAALRLGALAIVLFCLTRPVLVLKAAVPQQNFLGILLDDSRSMRVADLNGKPRSGFVDETFGRPDSAVLGALSKRFVLRFFRFSSSAERIASPRDLTFGGTQTHVEEALQRAREELTGLPLAGLVMVTDGADTSQGLLEGSLLALRSEQVPVFTVGVGREVLSHDIQISRVATPRSVLKGASLAVDVILTQSGYQGARVSLNVEDGGHIVSTQEVTLPADGEPAAVRVRFTASEAGSRVFRFSVPPQAGEEITQNNVRDALIEVEDRREKILYFEGEPRFEVKFIRRAVTDDKNLQLAVLQRTAENKYLRLDVDNPEELVAGFPKTRDELFSYRALVLGSIEAAAFTGDQLQMIADFVDRRGGGLLMLGGPRAFAEGRYAGTPIADVLPVVLEPPGDARDGAPVARLRVRPTRAGSAHPMTQIAKTEQESAARWSSLPEVTSVNPVRGAKPGATILLSGTDQSRREQIVLASQRYGRGKALAFPVQDSWVWQMHASVPVDDMTHENFWRQLLRWLVDGVPDKVEIQTLSDSVEPGEQAALVVEVADSAYVEVNDARVVAKVTGPSGDPIEVPLLWTGQRNGEYRTTFVPAGPGLHEIQVEAVKAGRTLGTDTGHLRVGPSDSEYFDATMRASLLQRISQETGGRFYPSEHVAALADDVNYTGRGVTTIEERDLWDMPALLLLLLGLMLGEWTYRRACRLA